MILCIDRGSSSIKIAAYHARGSTLERILEGEVEPIGTPDCTLRIRDSRDTSAPEIRHALGDAEPIAGIMTAIRDAGMHIQAVGHRLVYGGPHHELPALMTADLMTLLETFVAFDPLHLPDALAAIRTIAAMRPDLPQVVCFDTAFHRHMPMIAQRLPLPRELWAQEVRRYGYHGLAYESIVQTLGASRCRGKMIVAHLGNGASIAAIEDGRPVDTTMGFSPLGGLMMGTRPGDLDPGVLLYLLRERRYTVDELDSLITRRSGLLGVSGTSGDMRELLVSRTVSEPAMQAVELFVYQVKKHIGALAAILGGVNTLVFSGGIGEHAAPLRWEIGAGLEHLGIILDAARNSSASTIISEDSSRVDVMVVPADENLMVARHTYETLQNHV